MNAQPIHRIPRSAGSPVRRFAGSPVRKSMRRFALGRFPCSRWV